MNRKDQYIAAVGKANPEFSCGQAFGEAFLASHYTGILSERSMEVLHKVFAHPSVQRRYFAVDSPEELLNEDPDRRMERFTRRSVELSAQAARFAMKEAALDSSDITALVVNTCTGYICPGISTYLLEPLGLKPTTPSFDLVGSGCGGAVPNLQVAQGLLRGNPDGAALCISVEVCSCTFQIGNDMGLLVSNAIFGDGAAAAVVWNRPEGLRMVASGARYLTEYRDDVRYVYRNGQLHNHITLRLPKLAAKGAAQVTADVLDSAGLRVEDIDHWAIHPGGDSVITSVRDALGLSEEQVRHSRGVMADYGNMSSATVWFVLDKIRREGIAPSDRVMMLAFGAGMSAHAYLLQAVE
jgi:predicted naringenin-chalcone synthase